MRTIDLKYIIENDAQSGHNKLFKELEHTLVSNEQTMLILHHDLAISPSFLNASFGKLANDYDINKLKGLLKIKGNQAQFNRLKEYFTVLESIQSVLV